MRSGGRGVVPSKAVKPSSKVVTTPGPKAEIQWEWCRRCGAGTSRASLAHQSPKESPSGPERSNSMRLVRKGWAPGPAEQALHTNLHNNHPSGPELSNSMRLVCKAWAPGPAEQALHTELHNNHPSGPALSNSMKLVRKDGAGPSPASLAHQSP